jgi:outer membrane protein TolC
MDDKASVTYEIGEDVPAEVETAPASPQAARQLVADALSNRLELKAIDETYRSLDSGRKAIAAGRLPRLDAVADVLYANPNQRYFPQQSVWNASWSLGVVASWNVDELFLSSARSDEVAANAAQVAAQRRTLSAAIAAEVVAAQLDVVRARAALVARKTGIAAAEESYRVTTDHFQIGTATASDMVDAETDLLQARLAMTNARIDLAVAAVRLEHASGADRRPTK